MDFESRFEEGLQAYRQGDYHKAVAEFQAVAAVQPYASEVRLNLGNAYFKLNDAESAAACFLQALELDPMEANAYLNLGNLRFKQERFEEAVSAWETYKTLNRKNASVWLNLGLAYDKLGEPGSAFENYSYVLGLAPDSEDALRIRQRWDAARKMFENNIRAVDTYLARGDADAARDILGKALAAYPGNAKLYKTYASLLYQNDQQSQALVYYERAQALSPDDPAVLINLGVLYEKYGEVADALWAYDRVRAMAVPERRKVAGRFEALSSAHPNTLSNALSQAQNWHRQGRLRQAERLLTRLLQLAPALRGNIPEIQQWQEKVKEARDPSLRAVRTYYSKGIDAEAQGQFDQAMAFYNKFLGLKGEGPQADEVRNRLANIRNLMQAVVASLLDKSS